MSADRQEIVVAIDGSDNCHRALLAAADMADAMGRDLALLYVYPIGHPDAQSSQSEAQRKQHQEAHSTQIFNAALAELGSRARPVAHHLLVGDPAAEIIDFMQTHPNCHLVMGRRGLSKIRSLVLGSVSDKVTRHSSGLVTTVS
jgi:nucleotide-binding universal stress UspA family protein